MNRLMRRYACLALLSAAAGSADTVRVHHLQGDVHAYLLVRDGSGKLLGTADEVNMAVGRVWRSRLTIHFLDGSVDEDTATYTQSPVLRLLTDRHVQRGPAFPRPADVSLNTTTGMVIFRDLSAAKADVTTEHMDLPADLGNGIMPMVLQNMPRGAGEVKVHYMVNAPKPRLVVLAIRPDGAVGYRVGDSKAQAAQYVLHVDIGGVEGLLAPLVGKQPPDMAAWLTTGDAPTLIRLKITTYLGGPLLHMELASPQW